MQRSRRISETSLFVRHHRVPRANWKPAQQKGAKTNVIEPRLPYNLITTWWPFILEFLLFASACDLMCILLSISSMTQQQYLNLTVLVNCPHFEYCCLPGRVDLAWWTGCRWDRGSSEGPDRTPCQTQMSWQGCIKISIFCVRFPGWNSQFIATPYLFWALTPK